MSRKAKTKPVRPKKAQTPEPEPAEGTGVNARTCIVTRRAGPAEAMIRFVCAPDGSIVPDLKARLPGRGAWVSANAGTVRAAMAKGHFARAMKQKVTVPPDLAERLGAMLKQQALDALGMAMGAGQVISGFAKAEAAIGAGKAGVVLHAADGAPDGLRKLKQAARRAAAQVGDGLTWVTGFNSDELGLAIGRESVVHAVVKPGRMAEAFARKAMKWRHYEGAGGNDDEMTAPAGGDGQE